MTDVPQVPQVPPPPAPPSDPPTESTTPTPPRSEQVRLYGSPGGPWQPVSPRLVTVRSIAVTLALAPVVVPAAVAAALVTPWIAIVVLAGVLSWGWSMWLIRRQVPMITWAEFPEELLIRKGRLFRSLSAVPYGRLQYVDVQSGPLQRRFGLANLSVHTASPSTSGDIPGLSLEQAEALRTRLAARGQTHRAGL